MSTIHGVQENDWSSDHPLPPEKDPRENIPFNLSLTWTQLLENPRVGSHTTTLLKFLCAGESHDDLAKMQILEAVGLAWGPRFCICMCSTYCCLWRLYNGLQRYWSHNTSFTLLFKIHFMPLSAFTKDLHWYLLPLIKRNPKRIFAFMKKKVKSENIVQHLFCSELLYRQPTQEVRVAPPSSFLGTRLSISASSCHRSKSICALSPFILCIPLQGMPLGICFNALCQICL